MNDGLNKLFRINKIAFPNGSLCAVGRINHDISARQLHGHILSHRELNFDIFTSLDPLKPIDMSVNTVYRKANKLNANRIKVRFASDNFDKLRSANRCETGWMAKQLRSTTL